MSRLSNAFDSQSGRFLEGELDPGWTCRTYLPPTAEEARRCQISLARYEARKLAEQLAFLDDLPAGTLPGKPGTFASQEAMFEHLAVVADRLRRMSAQGLTSDEEFERRREEYRRQHPDRID